MRGVRSAQFRFFIRPFSLFRASQNPDCCWKYGAALGLGFGFGAAAPQSRAAGGRPRGSTRPPDSSRRQQRRQHEQQQQQMRMHKAIRATTTAPAIAHTAMETSHTPAPLPLGPEVPDVHEAKKLAQLHWVSAGVFAQPESSVPGGFHGKRVVHCFAHATAARLATHAAWSSITHGSWCSVRWCGSQPLASAFHNSSSRAATGRESYEKKAENSCAATGKTRRLLFLYREGVSCLAHWP